MVEKVSERMAGLAECQVGNKKAPVVATVIDYSCSLITAAIVATAT